jgi:hypothetical protein
MPIHFMFRPLLCDHDEGARSLPGCNIEGGNKVNGMKTRALMALLLAAAVGVASCQTTRTTPTPSPQPDPGTDTSAPPNPNPAPPSEPAPAATPIALPALATVVPDQPVAVPGATPARPHEDLVKLKQSGASEETLLNKIRTDGVNYHLTTADVIELKAAGFSEAVLQAMLRSGQPAPTR